jgi:hypothetical protein
MAIGIEPQDPTVEIRPGDRLDVLANRVLGNPFRYQELLELNSNLNIWDPKAGTIIKVPDA